MKKVLFPSNYYMQYVAPNAEELINKINNYDKTSIDNSKYDWGDYCSLNRIPLEAKEWVPLFQPSLELFATEINMGFDFIMCNPWLNLYKRGDHQELHDHISVKFGDRIEDFACVFAANEGEDFSKFYFRDRYDILTPGAQELTSDYYSQWTPDLRAGNIIFFPVHLQHGVSPHKSDVVRKTVAFNLSITSVTKK